MELTAYDLWKSTNPDDNEFAQHETLYERCADTEAHLGRVLDAAIGVANRSGLAQFDQCELVVDLGSDGPECDLRFEIKGLMLFGDKGDSIAIATALARLANEIRVAAGA